jgi:hypothetical protein
MKNWKSEKAKKTTIKKSGEEKDVSIRRLPKHRCSQQIAIDRSLPGRGFIEINKKRNIK